MDFKTHSDENGTQSHSTLDDAFCYADDHDDVEQISFILPTKEKVCLDRDMDDWSYNPIDSNMLLNDLEAKLLQYSKPDAPLYIAEDEEEDEALEDLNKRGFLGIADDDGEEIDYIITNLGMRALTKHHL